MNPSVAVSGPVNNVEDDEANGINNFGGEFNLVGISLLEDWKLGKIICRYGSF